MKPGDSCVIGLILVLKLTDTELKLHHLNHEADMFGSNQAACAQNQNTPTSTLCWTQTLTHRKLQMWLLLSHTFTALWVWATSSHRVTWVHLMNEVQCSLHFMFCFGLHQLHGKRLVSDWCFDSPPSAPLTAQQRQRSRKYRCEYFITWYDPRR